MEAPTISAKLRRCSKAFQALVSSKDLDSTESILPTFVWSDEFGRLKTWAANVGAHQRGDSSLDYRLRNSSRMRDQVLRLLSSLEKVVQILEDSIHDYNSGIREDGDREGAFRTAIVEIYQDLRAVVSNLYRLSALIRQPAQYDRVSRYSRDDKIKAYKKFDIKHVEDKFPNAQESLVERLALANINRRADLDALKIHRERLGRNIDQALVLEGDEVQSNVSGTVATDYTEISGTADTRSLGDISDTTFSGSLLGGGDGISVPRPPIRYGADEPFECPFCYFILEAPRDSRKWAQHVFSDLRAYVCVYAECSDPNRLFETRRAWSRHLWDEHLIENSTTESWRCELCSQSHSSFKKLKAHLAKHLQELALFVLPRDYEEFKSSDGEDLDMNDMTDAMNDEHDAQLDGSDLDSGPTSEFGLQAHTSPDKWTICSFSSYRLSEYSLRKALESLFGQHIDFQIQYSLHDKFTFRIPGLNPLTLEQQNRIFEYR